MFIRQVRRKCGVRGCKCVESYAISRTREPGNSVIICIECLEAALSAIGETDPATKSNIRPQENVSAPPLFFNTEAFGEAEKAEKAETAADESEADTVDKPEKIEEYVNGGFVCVGCGRVFDSEKGLKSHARYCGGGDAK